jgi:hypothetical protein
MNVFEMKTITINGNNSNFILARNKDEIMVVDVEKEEISTLLKVSFPDGSLNQTMTAEYLLELNKISLLAVVEIEGILSIQSYSLSQI